MQLEKDHPVAYIDAWSDDFIAKPIVALGATLEDAFKSVLGEEDVGRNWKEVASTTGKVAWMAAKGASLQVAKLALSSGAVAGIETLIDPNSIDGEAIRDSIKDGLAGDGPLVEPTRLDFRKYFLQELDQYRSVKSAIRALKSSLSEVAQAAEGAGKKLPVFIIVDELDRCRPVYAIQFLEEIKHVFGVKEVCFILGVNSEKLQKSICHQYGPNFNGRSYLDRFIDRYLLLPSPDLSKICNSMIDRISSGGQNLVFLKACEAGSDKRKFISSVDWLAKMMEFHNIGPRKSYKFFDRLQTSMYLLKDRAILMDYICELIAIDMEGLPADRGRDWSYHFQGDFGSKSQDMTGDGFFKHCDELFGSSGGARRRALNQESAVNNHLIDFAGDTYNPGAESYRHVVKRVARFMPVDD